jgi:hypothetical protein
MIPVVSNACRRRNALSSCIAAVILSVASIGSTALADDCPLIAEPCACQSGPSTVQAVAPRRPVHKRASAKSTSVSVSKSESVAAVRKPIATSSN